MNPNELFDRYFERTLTADELSEFKGRLRDEPGFGEALVDFAVETSLVVRIGTQMEELGSQAGETTDAPSRSRGFWMKLAVPLAAAAAVLAVAGGVFLISHLTDRPDRPITGMTIARMKSTSPGVVIQRGRERVAAEVGTELYAGDRVETAEGQTCALGYEGEETEVEAGERSTFNVQHSTSKGGRSLFLDRGRLVAVVGKRDPGNPFVVTTAHAEMRVTGTRFSVAALEDRTRLMVEEGTVRIVLPDKGISRDVKAGAAAVAGKGASGIVMPGKVLSSVDIGRWGLGKAEGAAYDGKRLWLYFVDSGMLVHVNPDTREIEKKVKLEAPFPEHGSGMTGLAWDGTHLWGRGRPGMLRAVDPETGKTIQEKEFSLLGNEPFDIHEGTLWIFRRSVGQLLGIERATGKVLSKISMPATNWGAYLAYGPRMFFFAERSGKDLGAFDPADGQLFYRTTVASDDFFYGGDMAYDPQRGLWCSSGRNGRLILVETE